MPVENPMVKAFDQVRDSIRSRIAELLHKHSEDTRQYPVQKSHFVTYRIRRQSDSQAQPRS